MYLLGNKMDNTKLNLAMKTEIKRIVIDCRENKLNLPSANRKLEEISNMTKYSVFEGHKREIKQDIFKAKKIINRKI